MRQLDSLEEAELSKDLDKIIQKHNLTISDLNLIVKHKNLEKDTDHIISEMEANNIYVNTYYKIKVTPDRATVPEMYRYFKVISHRSPSELRVSCLVFDEKPHYNFKEQIHLAEFPGDMYLGKFKCHPVWIDDVMIKYLQKAEKIEEHEYNTKFLNMANSLLNMSWEIDDKENAFSIKPSSYRPSTEALMQKYASIN